jgi:hypothetical protein
MILSITILLLTGICPLNVITSDFSGDTSPKMFSQCCAKHMMLSANHFLGLTKVTWSSASSSVLSTVSSFTSITFPLRKFKIFIYLFIYWFVIKPTELHLIYIPINKKFRATEVFPSFNCVVELRS